MMCRGRNSLPYAIQEAGLASITSPMSQLCSRRVLAFCARADGSVEKLIGDFVGGGCLVAAVEATAWSSQLGGLKELSSGACTSRPSNIILQEGRYLPIVFVSARLRR